ncbi:MAG: hypothetical protein COA57_10435 [Flavobacteriales bacterium]|nr:MAG: hypothetical protein COA57_10435 [Flavobacteriales bacterium]
MLDTEQTTSLLKKRLVSLRQEYEKEIHALTDEFNQSREALEKSIVLIDNFINNGEVKEQTTVGQSNGLQNRNEISFRQKVFKHIKERERFVHINELAEELHDDKRISFTEFKTKLNYALSPLKKKGVYNYKQNNSKIKSYWGLTEWLDDNKKILEKYNPDKQEKDKKRAKQTALL